MSACEKCWRDANLAAAVGRDRTVSHAYQRLLDERTDNPCTPEQQAGDDAKDCLICARRTLHQYTGECMNPECRPAEVSA